MNPELDVVGLESGELDERAPGLDALDVVAEGIEVEGDGGEEVNLVEDDDVGGLDEPGVLVGFVVAGGDTEHGDEDVLADVGGRSGEVADVFDEEKVKGVEVKPIQGIADVSGIDGTACLAGVDLDDLGADGGNALGVST